MSQPVLSVRNLTTVLDLADGPVPVVSDVSFDVFAGETLGLVGESGCGKSMTMLSVMGLHPQPPARIVSGEVVLEGVDLIQASEERRRAVRGAELAMVYQDPMTSLNPLLRIGYQISEVLIAHGRSKAEGEERTLEVLSQVGIPQPHRAVDAYPHEFSGGMRQRVAIAMALALRPKVLIADEPTTALDVTIQQQIVNLVSDLQEEMGMAVVWVTHDLGLVARVAERILVMYAGLMAESGFTRGVFHHPYHPYTAGLLEAIPSSQGSERPELRQIPGTLPDPSHRPTGCPFHPRCPNSIERCTNEAPLLTVRDDEESSRPPEAPNIPHQAACWVQPSEWVT